jgi:hypothetical protein
VKRGELVFRELGYVLDRHLATRTWIARHVLAWFERVKALDAWKKTAA